MDSEGTIITLARGKIDAEIAALKERIRALHTERNRLAPISRFPPEVMTQIFTCLQHRYFFHLHPSRDIPPDYRKWIMVTHVSQNWRQIAMSSKSLWNIIPIRWLNYATESFNRVGSMPIFVFGNDKVWQENYSALWESITAECHRIRLIRGVAGSTVADFKRSMPLLEHVEIPSKCKLSPSIISPSLRTLIFSSCDFTWDWPALPHLATLEISDPTQTVSLDGFLGILQNSPHLERLKTRNIFLASAGPHDFGPVQPTSLSPKLSSLHTSETQFSLDLLSRLRFTDGYTIDVNNAGSITMDSVPRLMQVINRILLESSVTIHRVGLTSYTSGYEYNSHLCLSLEERLSGGGPSMKLIFDPRVQGGGRDRDLFVRHLTILPLDEVEILTSSIIKKPVTWKESGLGRLPNLRSIDLREIGDASSFLQHIVEDYKEFTAAAGQLSFTALEEVKMSYLYFGRELKSPVCAALAGRQKAGHMFQKLVISSGQVSEDSAKQLQKYVDELRAPVFRRTKGRQRR